MGLAVFYVLYFEKGGRLEEVPRCEVVPLVIIELTLI